MAIQGIPHPDGLVLVLTLGIFMLLGSFTSILIYSWMIQKLKNSNNQIFDLFRLIGKNKKHNGNIIFVVNKIVPRNSPPQCAPPFSLISLVHNNRFLHWSGIFNPDIRICNVNNMVDLKISGTFQHHFWSHHRSHRLFLHFHHWRICSFGILNFTFVLWNLWLEYHQINVFERFFNKQCS